MSHTKARTLLELSFPKLDSRELPLDAWSGQVLGRVGSATDERKWGKHGPLRSISDPRSFGSWICPEHPEINPFAKEVHWESPGCGTEFQLLKHLGWMRDSLQRNLWEPHIRNQSFSKYFPEDSQPQLPACSLLIIHFYFTFLECFFAAV